MAEVLIEARGLAFTRRRRAILKGVDIAVRRGEIVTVIGPNGAGKSTLCRILLGALKPDAGTVTQAPGLKLGYVPQRFSISGLIPLSVRRFVALARPLGPEKIDRLFAEVGIPHLRDADVAGLSGGEFQRAALARALAGEPDLLVLDEPAQGLDISGEARLYELIGRIRETHRCAVLMVSHDLHVVMAASDRVICLNGHICCEGVPRAVSADPEYARLFGPAAAASLAVYAHRHDHDHDVSGKVRRPRKRPAAAKTRKKAGAHAD